MNNIFKQFLFICSFIMMLNFVSSCAQSNNNQKNIKGNKDQKATNVLPAQKIPLSETEKVKVKVKDPLIFSRDTIKIEEDNYKNKILLSKEMLFDYCKPASSLPCYIDADKFLDYIGQGVYNVYDPKLVENGLFTEEELVNNLASIEDYIESGLAANNELELLCPSSRQREKMRNMLKDINHSIYYLIKWPYFADRLKAGEIQIYSKSLKQSVAEIYREEVHKDGRKLISYYLDLSNDRYYADNLKL